MITFKFQENEQKERVDNVRTFGFGLGRTSAGLARIRYVVGNSLCLQALECGSSPTSGTADPLVGGDFCFNVCTKLCGGVPLTLVLGLWPGRRVAYSRLGVGGFKSLASGPSACCVLGLCVPPSLVVAAWLAAYLFMVRACLDDMTWATFSKLFPD